MKEIITVKVNRELKEEIDELARDRLEKRSDLIRSLLRQFIKQEKSKIELKKILGKKFAEEKITFDDLVKMLGYEEAKKAASWITSQLGLLCSF